MNRNIEIINPYLISVKFSYIAMGWIKEIPSEFHVDAEMYLCDEGLLILNKDSDGYEGFKEMFNCKIMPIESKKLELCIQEMKSLQELQHFDNVMKMYLRMLEIEKERRALIPKEGWWTKLCQLLQHKLR